LYFRLNVVSITMPSLRDRPNDIPALAEYFIEKYRPENGRISRRLSTAALNALMDHDWPGNVRELENTIHRAMVLTTDAVISAEALEVGPGCSGPAPARGGRETEVSCRSLHLMERDAIINTLRANGGNRTRTATSLGLSIRALRNKIILYTAQGIEVPPSSAARLS
jgi:two-component system response regulator FlrC